MKLMVDFCLIPLATELSLSPYVAACERILEEAGLEHQLHAYGTNIEGEWDDVMAAVKDCHAKVHQMGAQRIVSTLKLGTRIDKEQSLNDKVASVERLLNQLAD